VASNLDFTRLISEHYGQFAHPQSKADPPITVSDWPVAQALASATKFGGLGGPASGHAAPHEVDLFWQQFKQLNMAPKDYLDTLDRLSQWSFRYHGRPPTMKEIADLHPQRPADQQKHYQDLPDGQYPDLTAGQMMKAHAVADYYSKKHLGKGATKLDARLVHHGNLSADAVDTHFKTLASDAESKKAPKAAAEPF
jgi:hypothetical protein